MEKSNVPNKSNWLCIHCGFVLGYIFGGELNPAIDGKYINTKGPNLVLRCPTCGAVKVFYTADPIVRAIYQLTDAVATVAAKRMVEAMGQQVTEMRKAMSADADK